MAELSYFNDQPESISVITAQTVHNCSSSNFNKYISETIQESTIRKGKSFITDWGKEQIIYACLKKKALGLLPT